MPEMPVVKDVGFGHTGSQLSLWRDNWVLSKLPIVFADATQPISTPALQTAAGPLTAQTGMCIYNDIGQVPQAVTDLQILPNKRCVDNNHVIKGHTVCLQRMEQAGTDGKTTQ